MYTKMIYFDAIYRITDAELSDSGIFIVHHSFACREDPGADELACIWSEVAVRAVRQETDTKKLYKIERVRE